MNKIRLLGYFIAHPRQYMRLRHMVRHPDWKKMLSTHPLRSLESFRELMTHHFSSARPVLLNHGFRTQTVAFHSGPIGVYRKKSTTRLPRTAVMDWGVGGLGFYGMFKKAFPRVPVLYISDSGYTPYGMTSSRLLKKRLRMILTFLETARVRRLVIACNAMSAVLEDFQPDTTITVTGIIRPAIEYLEQSNFKTVGVIGDKRTIALKVFSRGLHNGSGGKKVLERCAQSLPALIEAGDIKSRVFKETLAEILIPLQGVEVLAPACTYYEAVGKRIRTLMKKTEIVDPAEVTLAWVKVHWQPATETGTKDIFFTTGDRAATVAAAEKAFGVRIREIHPLDL